MASVSDVQDALADIIVAALYPNSPASSVVGHPVKVYAGWPDSETLDADMVETNGKPVASHVSIYPLPAERNTTRYPVQRVEHAAPPVTYSLATSGQTVTVGGAPPNPYVPQNLGVFLNGIAYIAQATPGQTAPDVAALLLAQIQADYPAATLAGATITVPDNARITSVQTGSTGSTTREVRRQERQFQISVWSSNPSLRALIADAFDPIMADTPRVALADDTFAWLSYRGSREDDFTQKQRIYRRSLIWCVEYGTTRAETAAQMIAGTIEGLTDTGTVLLAGFDFTNSPNSGLQPLL